MAMHAWRSVAFQGDDLVSLEANAALADKFNAVSVEYFNDVRQSFCARMHGIALDFVDGYA
ncbi:MAG: hypothetical protein P8Y36_14625 [Alphaproteobacteria bacterium]